MIKIERHKIARCACSRGKLYYVLTNGVKIAYEFVKVISRIIHKCPKCDKRYESERRKVIGERFGQCLECECETRYPNEEDNSLALAFLFSFDKKPKFNWVEGRYWEYDPLFGSWKKDDILNQMRGL